MKKILMIFLTIALFAFDKEPSKITTKDKKIVQNIENLAYRAIEKDEKKIDISKIYQFIIQNKKYNFEIDKYKLSAVARGGYKRNQAYIEFQYKIIDSKTKRDYKLKDIQDKQNILNDIKNLATSYENIQYYKRELKFLRYKYHLKKVQALQGVEYREKVFDLLEKINQIKQNLNKSISSYEAIKLNLETFIKKDKVKDFEELVY